jgi:hypothetical protein
LMTATAMTAIFLPRRKDPGSNWYIAVSPIRPTLSRWLPKNDGLLLRIIYENCADRCDVVTMLIREGRERVTAGREHNT